MFIGHKCKMMFQSIFLPTTQCHIMIHFFLFSMSFMFGFKLVVGLISFSFRHILNSLSGFGLLGLNVVGLVISFLQNTLENYYVWK